MSSKAGYRAIAAALGSLAAHFGLALWAGETAPVWTPRYASIEVAQPTTDTEGATDGTASNTFLNAATEQETFGGAIPTVAVDSEARGTGGNAAGTSHVMLMLPNVAPVTLAESIHNDAEQSQAHRIRSSNVQQSFESRRSTPNPREDRYVSSGDGTLLARADLGPTAQSGELRQSQSSTGSANPTSEDELGLAHPQAATAPPSELSARGLAGSVGDAVSRRLDSAEARPDVRQSAANAVTPNRGQTSDTRDSTLRSRESAPGLADTTQALGDPNREGASGLARPGASGSGQDSAAGGAARAAGDGTGDLNLDDRSARLWYQQARRCVDRHARTNYPAERRLRLDSGTATFRIEVSRDGRLASRPERMRSSRFVDLDAAALRAVEACLPLPPLPAEVNPGALRVRIVIPVNFVAAMVT